MDVQVQTGTMVRVEPDPLDDLIGPFNAQNRLIYERVQPDGMRLRQVVDFGPGLSLAQGAALIGRMMDRAEQWYHKEYKA